mmetsp:Transcript_40514/g.120104  ORF Transcript_40514/g.120104 Transcript_40514/m.120104 type:complete len:257 (+) Transcript_40514:587-1357(+)
MAQRGRRQQDRLAAQRPRQVAPTHLDPAIPRVEARDAVAPVGALQGPVAVAHVLAEAEGEADRGSLEVGVVHYELRREPRLHPLLGRHDPLGPLAELRLQGRHAHARDARRIIHDDLLADLLGVGRAGVGLVQSLPDLVRARRLVQAAGRGLELPGLVGGLAEGGRSRGHQPPEQDLALHDVLLRVRQAPALERRGRRRAQLRHRRGAEALVELARAHRLCRRWVRVRIEPLALENVLSQHRLRVGTPGGGARVGA